MTTVALYTRVSTSHQAEEGYSLEAQENTLKRICEINDYHIFKVYSDKGISGKDTIHRPEFLQMMEDMRNGKFKKILVMKLDRISRSVADLESIIKELQKYNCGFESASEKIDTTSSMGLMFIRLLGVFAQFERERISERIKDAFVEKTKQGQALTRSLPYGYKLGKDEKNNSIVIKDSEKENIVNAMFDTYKKTSSLIKTCQYLNETYPDKVYKGGFNTVDIKRIMSNPMYYGYYRGNCNYCEPYVTKEKWKEVNNMRKNKNIKNPKKYTYLFSGIIKGACGHKLSGTHFNSSRKGINIRYCYRCSKYAHSGQCKNLNISEEVIENKILEMLPKTIDDFIKNYNIEYKQKKKTDYTKKIQNLENEKKRIVNSYNKGWIEESEAETEIKRIDEKIKEYSNINEPKKDYSNLKKIKNMKWLDMYKQLTREEKQLFFRNFIDYIVVDVEKYRNGSKDFISIYLLK